MPQWTACKILPIIGPMQKKSCAARNSFEKQPILFSRPKESAILLRSGSSIGYTEQSPNVSANLFGDNLLKGCRKTGNSLQVGRNDDLGRLPVRRLFKCLQTL